MLAVYAKLASHYLKRYGNAFGAAAMTGYNLGMWARKWQLSSSQTKLMEGLDDYWHDRAKQLGGWRAMWTDMWDRGGTAEVMKQLQQAGYWGEDDATKIYTGWSQQTWNANYKAILGQKYFEKYVAKILANHVRKIAEDEKARFLRCGQDEIRSGLQAAPAVRPARPVGPDQRAEHLGRLRGGPACEDQPQVCTQAQHVRRSPSDCGQE